MSSFANLNSVFHCLSFFYFAYMKTYLNIKMKNLYRFSWLPVMEVISDEWRVIRGHHVTCHREDWHVNCYVEVAMVTCRGKYRGDSLTWWCVPPTGAGGCWGSRAVQCQPSNKWGEVWPHYLLLHFLYLIDSSPSPTVCNGRPSKLNDYYNPVNETSTTQT